MKAEMDSARLWAASLTCALTWTGSQVVNQRCVWSRGSSAALRGAPGSLHDASDREDISVAIPLLPTTTVWRVRLGCSRTPPSARRPGCADSLGLFHLGGYHPVGAAR